MNDKAPASPLRDKVASLRAAGIAALQKNELEAAVSALRIVTVMTPSDLGAQRAFAAALVRTGKHKDAARVLEQVIVADAKDIEARCVVAELYVQMVRYLDAEKHLTACLQLDPKSETPHGVRARVVLRRLQRQLEEQLAAVKK